VARISFIAHVVSQASIEPVGISTLQKVSGTMGFWATLETIAEASRGAGGRVTTLLGKGSGTTEEVAKIRLEKKGTLREKSKNQRKRMDRVASPDVSQDKIGKFQFELKEAFETNSCCRFTWEPGPSKGNSPKGPKGLRVKNISCSHVTASSRGVLLADLHNSQGSRKGGRKPNKEVKPETSRLKQRKKSL